MYSAILKSLKAITTYHSLCSSLRYLEKKNYYHYCPIVIKRFKIKRMNITYNHMCQPPYLAMFSVLSFHYCPYILTVSKINE